MRLVRYHGLGNDYLVLDAGPTPTPALVRAICDRHHGVGSDGLLVPEPTTEADFGLAIYNPDGSRAEKSGNGLRIFARWLVEHRGAPSAFTVSTGPCRVACEVGPDDISVQMGTASFAPADVPSTLGADGHIDGVPHPVLPVGMGNPHAVIFVDAPDLDALPWRAWGEAIEVHPAFPNRTNVQIARVCGAAAVQIRIWERGAGHTLASGSSSCAVAAAAVHTGRLQPGWVAVHMEGGRLDVGVVDDFAITLRGPVERVGVIEVDPAWVARRRA